MRSPCKTYKDEGWAGIGDWLGTGFVAHQLRQYRRFKEARVFARSQGLRAQKERGEFHTAGTGPPEIPANPDVVYKGEGWAGMGDWLGIGFVAHRFRQHRHFEEARAFARSLGLRTQ